jgi:hypothetical protein
MAPKEVPYRDSEIMYEVLPRAVIKVPSPDGTPRNKRNKAITYWQPGDIIPPGALTQDDLDSLLENNLIREVTRRLTTKERESLRVKRVQRGGIWSLNPETLEGKDLDELLLIVLERDPNFDTDTLKTEEAAIKQLTRDWQPEFDEELSHGSDRTVPQLPRAHDVERGPISEGKSRPMSAKARAALERAQRRAQPTAGEHESTEDEE